MNAKVNKSYIVYFIVIMLAILIMLILAYNYINLRATDKYSVKALNGVIDLSDWDIDANPIQSLNGEWLFFYNQLLEPSDEYITAPEYIKVPGLWNYFRHDDGYIGPHGYATYRLRVLLPEYQQKTMALKIPDMSSSYRLFINGKEISSNGKPGKSYEEEIPSWKPLVRTVGNISGQMDIMVHISNYHHMKGGMWESILIGSEEAIFRSRELNLMISFFLIGVLLISMIYYMIVFSVIQSNFASLYLAMFCLAAATREFLIREVAATLVFSDIHFTFLSKLEYITVPSGPVLLALSVYGLYPGAISDRALKIIISPFMLYISVIIVTPLNVFGHLMNICLIIFVMVFIYLIAVIASAARKKRPGARLLLIGTLIMLLTAVVDMGYANMIHYNYNIAYTFSIGFIIFILCQMHSLSLIIAETVEKSQRVTSAELAFLQAQIAPHFLHNTLNTIIHLTRKSPKTARSLLLEFSNYLRRKYSFDMHNRNLPVSFDYELELVKSYLSIERIRFGGRLKVTYNIEEKVLNLKIVPFILQPLVENSVRHGLKNKAGECKITLNASCDHEHLIISIEDNGVGMSKEKILSILNSECRESGTGLYNVNKRIKTLYGESLEIKSSMNKGTAIKAKIPARRDKLNDKSYVN